MTNLSKKSTWALRAAIGFAGILFGMLLSLGLHYILPADPPPLIYEQF